MQRVTLIDNYDSFTFNLVHYLGELGADVSVWRNDAITVADAIADKPDAIVLSPGPLHAERGGRLSRSRRAAASETTPILGVCLGHQAIGQAFGGRSRARARADARQGVAHFHHARGLFRGLNGPFSATRYHSLVIERASAPHELEVSAESDDGLVMGVRTATVRCTACSSTPRASRASMAGKSCAISSTWRRPFISASQPSERETGHGIVQAADR